MEGLAKMNTIPIESGIPFLLEAISRVRLIVYMEQFPPVFQMQARQPHATFLGQLQSPLPVDHLN